MSSATLNPQAIENLRAISPDDDGEFLRELVDIFLADTPQQIADVEKALTTGNAPDLTRAAHSIKGSAANIGATQLGAAAARLETESKATPLPGLTPLIDAVKAEYARVAAELQKLTA